MIGVDDLASAVRNVRAVIQEHEVEPDAYLGLSEDANESIERMLSAHITAVGIPRSRREHRRQLLKFVKVGMVIGLEIARMKVERS